MRPYTLPLDVQPLSGAGEVEFFGHSQETATMPQFHRASPCQSTNLCTLAGISNSTQPSKAAPRL